jgi:hypothetical protein
MLPYTERAVGGRQSELLQLLVRESRFLAKMASTCRHRRGRLEGLRGRHDFLRGDWRLRLSTKAIFENEARDPQANRDHRHKTVGRKYCA